MGGTNFEWARRWSQLIERTAGAVQGEARPVERARRWLLRTLREQASEGAAEPSDPAAHTRDNTLLLDRDTLGHGLRDPLATMEGALHTLRHLSDATLPPDVKQLLDTLERHAHNLRRFTDDLLSGAYHSDLAPRRQLVDLVALAHAAAQRMKLQAQNRGAHIEVVAPAERMVLSADPKRVRQILENLLDHVLAHARRSETLQIQLKRQDAVAVVRVERSAGRAGTPEAGPSELRFPLSADSSAQDLGEAPLCPSTVEGLRLLLVEDNADLRELTAGRLRRRGFRVSVAGRADHALEIAEELSPDVLLTDIGLPGRDGYSLAQRVMRLPDAERCLRIAISGYGNPTDPARMAPFHAYLVKPLNMDELVSIVLRRVS